MQAGTAAAGEAAAAAGAAVFDEASNFWITSVVMSSDGSAQTRPLSATLKGFDRNLEMASQSLGASPLVTFRRVTFPLIRPGVVSGALFAFITSFDELVIAIFISGSTARTLPVKMWEGIRLEIDPTIAAVSSLLVALSVTLLLALALLRRERA